MTSEIERKTAFDRIRYAQVWEDGRVLSEAFGPGPGGRGLSIASAGDNALLMLARDPDEVVAVDINPAQLACLEFRVAAMRTLDRNEVLGLTGSAPMPARERLDCYRRCRKELSEAARRFWDARPRAIAGGIGGCGKFERYFQIFRTLVLPLAHGHRRVEALFSRRSRADREAFYAQEWDTWRWRALFHIFFSRAVMGALGRSPRFFDHVEGPVAPRILARVRYALTALNPAENPWLRWILLGTHLRAGLPDALPPWLEQRNYERIAANLGRLSWRRASVEEALAEDKRGFDQFNLSDIFEYMTPGGTERLLGVLCDRSPRGARLVYWNMLAPRSRPERLAGRLKPLGELAARLHEQDRAFFYSRLVIEERI